MKLLKLINILVLISCFACKEKDYVQNQTLDYVQIIKKLTNQGSWQLSNDMIEMCLAENSISGLSKTELLLLSAENYRYLEDYEKSEERFRETLNAPPKDNTDGFLGEAYFGLGDLYYLKWNFFKVEDKLKPSRAFLDSSMVYAKKAQNLKLESKLLYRQGTILQILGNAEEARESFERGHQISLSVSDTLGMIRNTTHRADGFARLGLLDSALVWHKRSYLLAKAVNRNHSEAHALGNLGFLYLSQDNVTKARDYFMQAMLLSEELNNKILVCKSYYGMCLLEDKLGNSENATAYTLQGLKLAREIGYKNFEDLFVKKLESIDHKNMETN